VPDLEDRKLLVPWSMPSTNCARRPAAGLPRPLDGGLWAAACEMAFAGQTGLSLNVDLLVTEGDGISDSRPTTATPRTGRPRWARVARN
jgi:phosphoribosylformylglycinamidine synthase